MRDHAVVAEEHPISGFNPLQDHPSAMHVLVAEDRLISDEVVLAHLDQIVAAREVGRDLRAPTELAAHQTVPVPHEYGRIERVERLEQRFRHQRQHPLAEVEARENRIAARLHTVREQNPPHHDRAAHRHEHQRERGRPSVNRHHVPRDHVVEVTTRPVVEIVKDVERREDRQQPDHHDRVVGEEIADRLPETRLLAHFRVLRKRGLVDHTDLLRRRAVPALEVADYRSRRYRCQVADFRALAQLRIVSDNAAVADMRIRPDIDRPDIDEIADHLDIGELDLRAEARTRPDRDEVDRAFLELVDDGIAADLGAERPQVDPHQRRALQELVHREVNEALHQPDAEIIPAPKRIDAGLGAADHQPFHGDDDQLCADVQRHVDRAKRDHFDPQRRLVPHHVDRRQQQAHPLRRHDRNNERQRDELAKSTQKTPKQRRRIEADIPLQDRTLRTLVERRTDLAQRPQRIHVLQRDRCQCRVLAQLRHEPRRDQRVAPQIGKEVRVEIDDGQPQHRFGGSQQLGFRRCTRFFLFALLHRHRNRHDRKRLAVDLARSEPRQRFVELPDRRHHVRRHLRGKRLLGSLYVKLFFTRHHMRDERLAGCRMLVHCDRRRSDTRLVGNQALDLTQLDSIASDFHLVVDTPVEGEAAHWIETDGVAGAIKDRITLGRRIERIGDEFLRRHLRQIDIDLRNAGAADDQLSGLSRRQQLHVLVDDVGRVVRDRLADRHGIARLQLGVRCNDCRLGRTIGVEQEPSGLCKPLHQSRRARLAAQHDHTQRRHVPFEHRQQRRHGIYDRYALCLDDLRQPVGLLDRIH